MNKPKFVIQPKQEERHSGNKLAFSAQAREEARRRLMEKENDPSIRVVTDEKLKVIPYRRKSPDEESRFTLTDQKEKPSSNIVMERGGSPRVLASRSFPFVHSDRDNFSEAKTSPPKAPHKSGGMGRASASYEIEKGKPSREGKPPFRIGIDPVPVTDPEDLDELVREVLDNEKNRKQTDLSVSVPKKGSAYPYFPGLYSMDETENTFPLHPPADEAASFGERKEKSLPTGEEGRMGAGVEPFRRDRREKEAGAGKEGQIEAGEEKFRQDKREKGVPTGEESRMDAGGDSFRHKGQEPGSRTGEEGRNGAEEETFRRDRRAKEAGAGKEGQIEAGEEKFRQDKREKSVPTGEESRMDADEDSFRHKGQEPGSRTGEEGRMGAEKETFRRNGWEPGSQTEKEGRMDAGVEPFRRRMSKWSVEAGGDDRTAPPQEEVFLSDVGKIYDEPDEGKRPRLSPPSKRRNLGWFKLLSSIIGAILLGFLFGYLLLMLLISGDWFKEASPPPAAPPSSADQGEGNAGTKVIPSSQVNLDPSQAGQAAAGALQLADRTFYAIQGGVFTDQKTGDAQAEAIRKKGLPALLFNDDSLRLFLGVSYRKEDAVNLAGYFQNKGVEIYLKEYTVSGGKMLFPNAKEDEMQKLNLFITHGTYLLEKTAAWSGQGVIGKANISDEEWKKFKDTHRLFLLESKQVEPILSGEQKGIVSKMTTEMNTAITGMVEYVKNPDVQYLLQSQQALLAYFDQYRKLLASAGVNVSYKA